VPILGVGRFYSPFRLDVGKLPLIVYPCLGTENVFDRSEPGCLEAHVREVYAKNKKLLDTGAYYILILWNDSKDRMADVWIFDKLDSWGSGPLADVKVFRNFELEQNIGVSAGDGLIMLGREEEQRRKSASLAAYLDGKRPEMPAEMVLKESFDLRKSKRRV